MLDPRTISKPGTGSSNLQFGKPLGTAGGVLVVCWHGGLAKNHTSNTVPVAEVVLKTVHPDGKFGSTQRMDAAISHLGSLRPGSVWKNGRLIGEIRMDTLEPTVVNLNPGTWDWVTAESAGLLESYLSFLSVREGRSWLIQMRAEGGKTILVPCLEFLTRCYGYSSETNWLLATYGLEEIQKRYLYGVDPDPEAWVLKLKRRVSSREAPFLAHAIFDEYTNDLCNRLHKRLQADFKPGKKAFIKVEPWFTGFPTIEGRGYWLNTNTFLLLNVNGMSQPDGHPIIVERQDYAAAGWAETEDGRRPYVQNPPPGSSNVVVSLIDDEAPDSDTPRTVHNPPFRTLGTKREIIRRKEVIPGRRGDAIPGSDRTALAPGDAHGNGRGGGKSEFASPEAEPEGSLAQMWQTCNSLSATLSGYVSEVGWYTRHAGFQTEGVPSYEYISTVPPEKDGTFKRAPKRILVIRMTVEKRHVYILEIFRKPRSTTTNGKTKHYEDGYRGLMVMLPSRKIDVDLELGVIFQNILKHDGRIKDTTMSSYPHATFVHRPRDDGPEPFRKVILNNLRGLVGPV